MNLGTCRVEKVFDQTHLRVLATLKTSEIFGEMGFMSGLRNYFLLAIFISSTWLDERKLIILITS